MFSELVDIKEDRIQEFDYELLAILLKDKSTNKNIVLGTDNYKSYGFGFSEKDNILLERITGQYGELIKPRIRKTKEEQVKRIRDKAEVFTPSWIYNKQNNLIDNDWFERENVFNKEDNMILKKIERRK